MGILENNETWVSPIFEALRIEATMASLQLTTGVTALGKTNYAQTAYYYQAFFSLSIGLERTAKLTLIVDYALDNNGNFPSAQVIRNYGHDLEALLRSIVKIAERRGFTSKGIFLPHSPIHNGIIKVLSDFANNITRYHNLDLITKNLHKESYNPVKAWHEKVTLPILELHYKPRHKVRDRQKAYLIDKKHGDVTFVRHHLETEKPIVTLNEAYSHIAKTNFAIPYSRMYVMQIIRFTGVTISELGLIAQDQRLEDIPYLYEIFGIYNMDDEYFRRRKTWSILG